MQQRSGIKPRQVHYTSGNGLANTRAVDINYRLISLQVGSGGSAVVDKTIGYDGASRVTSITDTLDPLNTSTYAYTTDGRLAQAVGPWGDLRWAYDGVGNRLVEDLYDGSGTLLSEADYTYPTSSNRLEDVRDGVGTVLRDFTYSGDGNMLTDTNYATAPDYSYTYDQAGRLSAVSENGALKVTYGYDAFSRRVSRSIAGGATVHYIFDAAGKPLAEHDGATGAVLREYIWIGNLMVGWSDGSDLYYVHGGHLGQPLAMTEGTGAVVWRAEFGPFGEVLPSVTNAENDLRFPGQWADGETKLLQNWHRDYDPSLGRYIQADPIGLAAGQSLYGYVGGDPVNFVDPMGLEIVVLNSRPFGGADNSRWGGMEHQAIIAGDDERGWTYVSKDGAECGCDCECPRGSAKYTISNFATFAEAASSSELARYDQALLHIPTDISRSNVDRLTDIVINTSQLIVSQDYDFLSNNCGDHVQRSLAAAGISLPDTINPQASINNMTLMADVFVNERSGDKFFNITTDLHD